MEVLGNSRLKKSVPGMEKRLHDSGSKDDWKRLEDVEEKALVDILYFRHSYIIASRKIS